MGSEANNQPRSRVISTPAIRLPLAQYAALGLLFIGAISYQLRFTAEQFPGLWGHSDAPHRPFYCAMAGDGPIQIYFPSQEAQKSGLRSGDTLIAVNQEPATGTAVFGEAMGHALAGDLLTVTVEHGGQITPTEQTTAITLQRQNAGTNLRDLATSFVLSVAMPFFCLFLGFWVAAVRPRNPQAWLLLGLMLSFAAFITPATEAWGAHWRVLATIYYRGFSLALPIFALLFGIYFPQPFPTKLHWPWWNSAKWLVGAPLVLLSAAHVISAVGEMENRASVLSLDRLLGKMDPLWDPLLMATFVVVLACLGAKWRLAKSTDARRRLQLLVVGITVSLAPKLILIAVSDFYHQPFETFPRWLYLPAHLLQQVLFPLTLAYVVVVYRAMDVRVVVRRGLQYALATRAIRVLQLVVAIAVIGAAVYVPITGLWSRPLRFITIALGVVLLSRFGKAADLLRAWTDRQFFRDAYSAELILSDLGEKVRTIVETGPLLQTVAGRIADSLHVRRVAIMLDGSGMYRPAYSTGYEDSPPEMTFPSGGALVRRLKKGNEASRVYPDDSDSWIYTDPEMTDEQRSGLARLGSELLIPFSVKDKLIGFMSLGPKSSEEPYSGGDLRLLKSVATQTGMALEVASLTASIGAEIAHRERQNRELEIAREVQERLFPQVLKVVAGLDYCGRCQPAREVGGDYYDFLELPGKRLGIALGDVSGKGLGAALMMAGLQAALRAQASIAGDNLAELMRSVNHLVYELSSDNRYATFFYAQYDPPSRQLSYVNAGHNPPAVFRKSDSEWQVMRLEVGGAVVGLLPQSSYAQGSFTLQAGDLLLAFTDGISEAMNPQDEEWGEEKLIEITKTCEGLSAADSVSRIMAGAHSFAEGASQHDDMTVVVLHVLSSAAAHES